MSESAQRNRAGRWIVLLSSMLSLTFFAFLLSPALRGFTEILRSGSWERFPSMITFFLFGSAGLAIELYVFRRVYAAKSIRLSDGWRIVQIFLSTLFGTFFLIVFPISSVVSFPETHRHIIEQDREFKSIVGSFAAFDHVLSVVIELAFLWVFISLGISMLKVVRRALDRLTRPESGPNHDVPAAVV